MKKSLRFKTVRVTVTLEGPFSYVVRVNGVLHSICGDEFTARQDAGRQYAANLPIRVRPRKEA